jgi:hypothetical protein
MSSELVVWVGALLTFAAYSFLAFGDNPAYGFCEHLLMGCASGYAVGLAVHNLKSLAFSPLAEGNTIYLIPIILGVLLYAKYIPRIAWVGRIPVALLVALASGVAATGAIQGQVIGQVKATMLPLTNITNITNIVLVLGVISVIWYFFLSFKARGKTAGGLSLLGRWMMMAAFGASFANIVTARFSILIGRFQFLLQTWLGLSL